MAFPGIGTVVNVLAVLVGSCVGLLLGARLPARTRDTVTDALGLVTLLIGALSAAEVGSAALADVVGSAAPVLIVLGALMLGALPAHCSTSRVDLRVSGAGCERGWGGVAPSHGNTFPPRPELARRSLDTFPRERSPPRLHPHTLPPGSASSRASLPPRWSSAWVH